jgi:hypothetical protein
MRLLGTRLCEPCAYLEGLTQKGVLAGLIHRGGLRADIVAEGNHPRGGLNLSVRTMRLSPARQAKSNAASASNPHPVERPVHEEERNQKENQR